MRQSIVRVSKHHPCPVCTKPDWCGVTADSNTAFCMRVSIGSTSQAHNGAFIHNLAPNMSSSVAAVSAPSLRECGSAEVQRADASRCDAVYKALLERLTLNSHHGDHLLNERGLSDTTIAAKLYASVPNIGETQDVCSELASRFDLSGVPGFYKSNGCWRLNACGDGIFIPYRDIAGRIMGNQIRIFGEDSKYIWLSSSGKESGASSGAPIHFVKPDLIEQWELAFITEGALKADVISERLHVTLIAIAGVTSVNFERFCSQLKQSYPSLKRVAIAFDSDWRVKREVCNALKRLIIALKANGLTVFIPDWDAEYGKGLDDYLLLSEEGRLTA